MGSGASALTPQQEKFCLAYIELGDATEAYLKASPHVKRHTAKGEGSKYLRNPNIANRLAELRESIVEETKITVASLIKELEVDRNAARIGGQPQAAINATEKIAKLAGLWVDKSETTVTMRPEEARALIAQLGAKYLTAGAP